MHKFSIELQGKTLKGFDKQQVYVSFAKFVNIDVEKAQQYFDGKRRVIKKDCSSSKAQALVKKLQEIGVSTVARLVFELPIFTRSLNNSDRETHPRSQTLLNEWHLADALHSTLVMMPRQTKCFDEVTKESFELRLTSINVNKKHAFALSVIIMFFAIMYASLHWQELPSWLISWMPAIAIMFPFLVMLVIPRIELVQRDKLRKKVLRIKQRFSFIPYLENFDVYVGVGQKQYSMTYHRIKNEITCVGADKRLILFCSKSFDDKGVLENIISESKGSETIGWPLQIVQKLRQASILTKKTKSQRKGSTENDVEFEIRDEHHVLCGQVSQLCVKNFSTDRLIGDLVRAVGWIRVCVK